MKLEQFFNNFGLSVNIVIIILLLVVIYYLHILNNNLSMEYFSIGGPEEQTQKLMKDTHAGRAVHVTKLLGEVVKGDADIDDLSQADLQELGHAVGGVHGGGTPTQSTGDTTKHFTTNATSCPPGMVMRNGKCQPPNRNNAIQMISDAQTRRQKDGR